MFLVLVTFSSSMCFAHFQTAVAWRRSRRPRLSRRPRRSRRHINRTDKGASRTTAWPNIALLAAAALLEAARKV